MSDIQRIAPLSDRVVDVAETYFGEWVSVASIAERLGAERNSVLRAIARRLPSHVLRRGDPFSGSVELFATHRAYLFEDDETIGDAGEFAVAS